MEEGCSNFLVLKNFFYTETALQHTVVSTMVTETVLRLDT